MKQHLVTAAIALVFGFIGAGLWQVSGAGDGLTRAYLIENADVLPDMAQALQRQEMEERMAQVGGEVSQPFPGAILGNPNGSKTIVEFTDYACGYCRQTAPELAAMVEADPELRVVIREWPIFPGSEVPARMALAAAAQGKYSEFHDALFALGQPSAENVRAAAEQAGMDMAAAQEYGQSQEVTRELQQNMAYAQQLGFTGTPSFVINGELHQGAIGRAALEAAVNAEG